MYSGKSINEFAKQLLAWSAIAMLFLQPLGLKASNCGCGPSKLQVAATHSCCGSTNQTCDAASSELSSTACTCRDQCRCSVNEPGKQPPVAPVNESQNEQVQTLAYTISILPVLVIRTVDKFGCRPFAVYRPALSAQQTCVLLSRFIV